MIRILQIIDHMSSGGIQAFVMNVYRHINKEEIQFDFLLHHRYDHSYYQEIERMGGKIFYVEPRNKGLHVNRNSLEDFFTTHPEYHVVHMHESSLSYLVPLEVAAKHHVRKKIFHSHSSSLLGSRIHKLLHIWHKREIGKVADYYLACGKLASTWMYGGTSIETKAQIVYNGINIADYTMNPDIRMGIRKKLGIGDELVMAHTGRFDKVKNHKYLIDIAKQLAAENVDFKLMLIGGGEMFEDIKSYAKALGTEEKILFMGVRSDVNKLLQAADVFVLPSLYEGFPVVAIEAMASGLPVILSDTISDEVAIKSNVIMKSLADGPISWAKEILMQKGNRIDDNRVLYDKGFDIKKTVEKLSRIYLE